MEPSIAELARRIETLEHINAIKDLKSRYWASADRQRLDEVRDCYLPKGAVIDFQGVPLCKDREEFIAVLKAQGGKKGFHSMHHGQNPRIRLASANEAEGLWDVYFASVDTADRTTIQMSGGYIDRYVYQDGRWWIASTQFRQTSFLMQKFDEKGVPTVISLGEVDLHAFGS